MYSNGSRANGSGGGVSNAYKSTSVGLVLPPRSAMSLR